MWSEQSSDDASKQPLDKVLGVVTATGGIVAGLVWAYYGGIYHPPLMLVLIAVSGVLMLAGEAVRREVPYIALALIALASGWAIAVKPPHRSDMFAALVACAGGMLVGMGDGLTLLYAAPVLPASAVVVGVSTIARGALAGMTKRTIHAAPARELGWSAVIIPVVIALMWLW